jgi:hypothetical protein
MRAASNTGALRSDPSVPGNAESRRSSAEFNSAFASLPRATTPAAERTHRRLIVSENMDLVMKWSFAK